MKQGLIITLVLTSLACSDDNVTTLADLNGKWVDINTKTDTLTFGLFERQAFMILRRGKEIRKGFLLPKQGAGFYDYKLSTPDKISLRWMFSSTASFNDYYFEQTGDK